MEHTMRLRFRRGDLLALALVLALAAALAFALAVQAAPAAATVQIYLDGRLAAELPLNRDTVYHADGRYHNTITIRDGTVAVTASDCPGGDCTRSGAVSAAGRSIVCLPNRMELRLVGGASDGVDVVVR